MKKLASFLVVCTVAVASLASCGDSNSKKDKEEKKAPDVSGKWAMAEMSESGADGGGIIFDKNGKGSIDVDVSSLLYMQEDGSMNLSGRTLDGEYIDYDGTNFKLNISGQDMLTMTKYEPTDATDFNGKYKMEGGMLSEEIQNNLSSGSDSSNVNLDLSFDGQKTEVIVTDILTYSIKDDKFTLDGYGKFIGEDDANSEFTYTLEGDKLTLTNDSETIELTKAE